MLGLKIARYAVDVDINYFTYIFHWFKIVQISFCSIDILRRQQLKSKFVKK